MCSKRIKTEINYIKKMETKVVLVPTDVVIVRSGDVHPLPGPNRQTNSAKLDIPKELKSNVKVTHLNVRSLKSRVHFCLVKDTILQNNFDIFTISETWADLTVSDASL